MSHAASSIIYSLTWNSVVNGPSKTSGWSGGGGGQIKIKCLKRGRWTANGETDQWLQAAAVSTQKLDLSPADSEGPPANGVVLETLCASVLWKNIFVIKDCKAV